MPTLFDLTSEMLAIEELLESSGGDITDAEVEIQIDQWLADLAENLNDKLDGYVMLVAEFSARAEARKKEAQRLALRSQVDQNNADRLKARLKEYFTRTGKKRVETARFKISLASNGGKVPLVLGPDFDLDKTPPSLIKLVKVLDADLVRTLLERGDTLEFASLGNRGTHIRIS